MAEAQKTSGGTSRTYNGVLELKRAAVAGETVVEGRMLRTVETPLLAAAARTPEQDVPVLGKSRISTEWRRKEAVAMWRWR